MKNCAFLSLGSNIGDRESQLYEAIKQLEDTGRIKVVQYSSIYETDPVGFTEQDLFLNMVIQILTDYKPFELLEVCLNIEKQLGRKRLFRWGPRNIDIDILLYNQENIVTEKLHVPHQRMAERAFVLVPFCEIEPDIIVPGFNQTIAELTKNISKKGVRIWKQKFGDDVYELFGN